MNILFGKLKIKVKPEHVGTKATIASVGGFTKEVNLVAPETNVILPGLEEYTITFAVNGAVQTFKLDYGSVVVCTSGWAIIPWALATWDEIAEICDRYYNNEITLEEIREVWSVGDRRDVSLPAMLGYPGGMEAHVAQTVELEIIGFDHDTLAQPINAHGKSLVTIQQHSTLANGKSSEHGRIHSDGQISWYQDPERRTWCNEVYLGALPSELKDIVKPVSKSTGNVKSTNTRITTEKTFLLGEKEVFGVSQYSSANTGQEQYEYYKNSINRVKYAGLRDASDASVNWWLRDGSVNSSANIYCYVNSSGIWSYTNIYNINGIAPAMCL